MSRKLLVFGGTTEGREISLHATNMGYLVTVCVATDYGEEQLPRHESLTVKTGRLDKEAIAQLIYEENFTSVIDATHPYAIAVSQNILNACEETGCRRLRLLRKESEDSSCTYFDSLEDACAAADSVSGNILAATGSKALLPYTKIRDYRRRVFVRVLPTDESIALCRRSGFPDSNIIAARGPFSKEENLSLLKKHCIRSMVTKDGGSEGGFKEKIRAAIESGAHVFVMRRPIEAGLSFTQVMDILREGL